MISERLAKQLKFVREVDQMKNIFRQSYILDKSRKENDAEHSWHFALMVFLLDEYAKETVDVLKVIKMVLIHDIVEIDAGDTYCYDVEGNKDKLEREIKAADRIFNILPDDQALEIRQLWDEFEAQESPEAKYAAGLDRLQPLMLNYYGDGISWKEHKVTYEQVIERNKHIGDGAPELWEFAMWMIDDAVEKGWLLP
ncbi:MAG: HD domain-containing protein [Lentisphaeria bacterium]|nr:HD domain-containing protein [Lentisphaeria bacterium]NQZ71360.1 HD domain-containing protein [Lentisphaeria bacterium]